ncbi:sulfurtransferase TusA family protein [Chloroflexota bacterium]
MKADQTLDCMGFYCPLPIVKTVEKMKGLKVGEVLEMIGDDKGILKDMPAWAEATGHEFLGAGEEGGEIKTYIKKTHD